MRLHRFIADVDLGQPTLSVTDAELVSQWRNVLRLKTGDRLVLSDGQGREAEAVITDMTKSEVFITLDEAVSPHREPTKMATLYAAILKRENFETVVQKATELGIFRIVPLLTERTVKTGFNRERLEKIIREAAEQSGRTHIPELAEPLPFPEALAETNPATSLILDLDGVDVGPALSATQAFIGPEGGFSDAEIALAREAGFPIGLLGKLTMRGETAAIVASYLITR